MIVGGIERPADVALKPLRKRDEPRELRQRQRTAKASPGALLQAEQRRIGADERSASIDAAANDAFAAHAAAPEPASSPASARAGSIASDASSGASAAESSRNGARRTGNAAASAVISASAMSA